VAKNMGIEVTTVVPDTAARSKVEALRALGAKIVEKPYRDWWALLETTGAGTRDPEFIHPVADRDVMAGNGTIGLEITEELPDTIRVFVPYGGGGLCVGIAAAIHGVNPGTIVACETEAGTPVATALAAGRPVRVPFNLETFITGMGSAEVLETMWPLVSHELSGARCVTLEQVADAIRRLAYHHHVIAEGAGAAPVACALRETNERGASVCIVSGGHLDTKHLLHLLHILAGGTPGREAPS
jgi:threonine dehydratase